MATVQIGRREAEDDDLPDVCMKCGAPATARVSRTFSWYPEWVWITILAGLLIFVILAIILTKRMRVQVPFCDLHKKHWFNRNLAIWGTFGILALLMVLAIGVAVAMADPSDQGNPVLGVFCIGGLLCLVPWLTVVAIAHYSMIRPSEITDRSIRLTKVSDYFVDAVEDYRYERRRAREDDDEDYRRKFRPRRGREESEDVYDPEPPRRRRSRQDEYEEER
jgi:hypothetical protein